MSLAKYSWHTSGSTEHMFLFNAIKKKGQRLSSPVTFTWLFYLKVPKASSTTSRVSSLNNLIKLPTTPFDNNNFKLASLAIIKLEIQAAAQPLSVESGDFNYVRIKALSIQGCIQASLLLVPCRQQEALDRVGRLIVDQQWFQKCHWFWHPWD